MPDRENPQNLFGFKALSLIRTLAEKYNGLYHKISSLILQIPNLFSNNILDTENEDKKIRLLSFNEEKLLKISMKDLKKKV